MFLISISSDLKSCCPQMALGVICCDISNSLHHDGLWLDIEKEIRHLKAAYTLENLKTQPEIRATREAYKATGKDPNRYRPSAEALCRRILRDMELYQISVAVDLINLISIRTGFSIGGFDADKIEGEVVADIGRENEPFEAIGRGLLNIDGLPVLRDEKGAIGTPTSDTMRTSLILNSKKLYLNFNAYRGTETLYSCVNDVEKLLKAYLCATNIETKIII